MTRVLVVDIPGWSDRFDDEAAAVRHFDPVIVSVENTVPLVRVLQPGRIAMGARGPARYYRGEDLAAEALRAVHPDARIGIADGLFTAVTAATRANPVCIVPVDRSDEFLAPLSVDRVGDADLVDLLRRLGITTLGAFAALDPVAVRDFLKDAKLPDPRPLIHVCDRFNFVEDLTSYLWANKLGKFVEVYVQKVAPTKTPLVVGKLLDLDAEEEFIRALLDSVRLMCPVEPLVEEVAALI